MGAERTAGPWIVALALALAFGSGCANQTPVIPMLHVEPSAASRIFYLERRAQAMFGKPAESAAASEEREDEDEDVVDCAPRTPRTWGGQKDGDTAADAQGSACDSRQKD